MDLKKFKEQNKTLINKVWQNIYLQLDKYKFVSSKSWEQIVYGEYYRVDECSCLLSALPSNENIGIVEGDFAGYEFSKMWDRDVNCYFLAYFPKTKTEYEIISKGETPYYYYLFKDNCQIATFIPSEFAFGLKNLKNANKWDIHIDNNYFGYVKFPKFVFTKYNLYLTTINDEKLKINLGIKNSLLNSLLNYLKNKHIENFNDDFIISQHPKLNLKELEVYSIFSIFLRTMIIKFDDNDESS